jgi:succinoglycan biosynthesis transport protein ExoP
MNCTQPSSLRPADLWFLLRRYPKRWLIPVVACTALGGTYGLFRAQQWEATQTLLLRNETTSHDDSLGSFRDADELKIKQETLIEVARSRKVLHAALSEVGPREGSTAAVYPRDEQIADLRDALTIAPANGAEMGRSEILHLRVRDRDKRRAVALAAAIARHTQAGLSALRDAKAQSLLRELRKTVDLNVADLRVSQAKLAALESQVGVDLAELRMLDVSATGDSDLRRRLNEIEQELREAQQALRSNEELLTLLQTAQREPQALLATPNRLLESQPALRRLKDGLVDAQIRTAQLLGSMTAGHPTVKDAVAAEEEIRAHLHRELATAIAGALAELRLTADRVDMLRAQRDKTAGQLQQLASLRAEYSALAAEVRHGTQLVEEARRHEAAARASQASAASASVLSLVDVPVTGPYPVGPGRVTILMAGCAGGVLLGMAVLFLTVDCSTAARAAHRQRRHAADAGRVASPAEAATEARAGLWPDTTPAPQMRDDALQPALRA